MAYLMVKYADPSVYAVMDLSADEFEIVARGLRELHDLYERFGDEAEASRSEVGALIAVLERRYADDID